MDIKYRDPVENGATFICHADKSGELQELLKGKGMRIMGPPVLKTTHAEVRAMSKDNAHLKEVIQALKATPA